MTIVEHVGWVLVHFIWQGTAIALALAAALQLTPAAQATLRYLLSCTALVTMLAATAVTAASLSIGPQPVDPVPAHSCAHSVIVAAVRGSGAGSKWRGNKGRTRRKIGRNSELARAAGPAGRSGYGTIGTVAGAGLDGWCDGPQAVSRCEHLACGPIVQTNRQRRGSV